MSTLLQGVMLVLVPFPEHSRGAVEIMDTGTGLLWFIQGNRLKQTGIATKKDSLRMRTTSICGTE